MNYFTDNAELQRIISDNHLEEYKPILEKIGEIAADVIARNAFNANKEEEGFDFNSYVKEDIDALCKAGLWGMTIPKQYGGLECPVTVFMVALEIIARADAGFAAIWSLQGCGDIISEFGTDIQKSKWLPRLAQGATAAMALSESNAGSDLQSVTLKASKTDEGKWVLNGAKHFITSGNADMLLVLARSEDGSNDARGLSLFVYDKSDGGLIYRNTEHKMGIRSSVTLNIEFTDAPVELVGVQRLGLIKYVMTLMNASRLAVAAQSVGIMSEAYDCAKRYASVRKQFGKIICEFPQIANLLLEMRCRISGVRAMLYYTSRCVDLSKTSRTDKLYATALTPLVKFMSSEIACQVAYDAQQIFGGYGYLSGSKIERIVRDSRVTSIYEGTSQLQIIAATSFITKGVYMEILDSLNVPDKLKDVVVKAQGIYDSMQSGYLARSMVSIYGYALMAVFMGCEKDSMLFFLPKIASNLCFMENFHHDEV